MNGNHGQRHETPNLKYAKSTAAPSLKLASLTSKFSIRPEGCLRPNATSNAACLGLLVVFVHCILISSLFGASGDGTEVNVEVDSTISAGDITEVDSTISTGDITEVDSTICTVDGTEVDSTDSTIGVNGTDVGSAISTEVDRVEVTSEGFEFVVSKLGLVSHNASPEGIKTPSAEAIKFGHQNYLKCSSPQNHHHHTDSHHQCNCCHLRYKGIYHHSFN